MKINAVAEACMWLPGFAPHEDPLQILGVAGLANTPALLDPDYVQEKVEAPRPVWAPLPGNLFSDLKGPVAKFHANVLAIKTLRSLEEEGRAPEPEEQKILNRFTGWGGLPQAFNADQSDEGWVKRSLELKELLNEAEYQSALESTTNSHYTPHEVISAMWRMLKRLGFTGGRIIEPSCGVGYFVGAMPTDMASKSSITMVELDSIPARIAKALYSPYGVVTHSGALERTSLPEGFYDLAVGNVPFLNAKTGELRNVPYADFTVHNYFFAKALDLVRPGGVVAFITSSFTMDAANSQVRKYLASKADLVAAVRLPSHTFKEIAEAEVTTDILILRKREVGSTAIVEPITAWMNVEKLPYSSTLLERGNYYGETPIVNEHYASNPDCVIGKLSVKPMGQMRKQLLCKFEGDLEEALQHAASVLPESVYRPRLKKAAIKCDRKETLQLEPGQRPGLRLIDGKVYEVQGDSAVHTGLSGKALDRVAGMIHLRDTVRQLIAAQISSDDDAMLSVYRTGLNVSYDTFVAKYGYINESANRRVFASDPDMPLLLSLEVWDSEEKVATKAPIFTRRTAGAYKEVTSCDTAEEALQVCLAERAHVDASRIANLLRKPPAEVMQDLEDGGHVFLDPETGHWVHADEYLSGHVPNKLLQAKASGDRYVRNVTALEQVQPKPLIPSEITARVGSTWIPTGIYEQFLDETLDVKGFKVQYGSLLGAWEVVTPYYATNSVAIKQTWGTERVDAVTLFEMELNQRKPTVYDKMHDGKQVVNSTATIAAREKQFELKNKFVQWLWSDEDRSNEMAGLYNKLFNCIVERKYNGDHLVLPGMSSVFTLRKHQRDAVWRVISSEYPTLLAHAVGAGKTLEMVCAGAELRRLGKASKVMYVVPNHCLYQFAAEYMAAYPNARVLAASKDDLSGERRRVLLSRIATCDWDAVIVTQRTFESIKVSDEHMKSFIQQEIDLIESAILLSDKGRGNKIVKQLARAKKTWKNKLDKLGKVHRKDSALHFEELGVDWLMVDECHSYKNLGRFTKMDRIAGLPNTNSDRAFDMLVKTRCVLASRETGGVTFASGTSISNTMAELWVMQRYLMNDVLERHQIENFDSWAANFGEAVTSLELAPDGAGYRMQTRFARFTNLPELMSLFRLVADIRTADMLDLPTPAASRETVVVEGSEALKDYVASLVERAEKIRKGLVKPHEDNMLKVTSDGRKAALDMRLVDPLLPDNENGKVHTCARNVFKIWKEYGSTKGAQVVFCDLSTPRKDGTFSVYDAMRLQLICMGIPPHEIAFIHDHDSDSSKEALFRSVRKGTVRVLLGSTEKMGVGTNIQDRLIALHHLDSPWRPSDLEQREGRIIRQGNAYDEVFVFTYITQGSFDAYMYQILHSKARFIAQILTGKTTVRTAEDAEVSALSYAEIKALASGNPTVLEKVAVDTELAKLSVLHHEWEHQRYVNKRTVQQLPASIEAVRQAVIGIEADSAAYRASAGRFDLQVQGTRCADAETAAKALTRAVVLANSPAEKVIGSFNGFSIRVSPKTDTTWKFKLVGESEYSFYCTHKGARILQMMVGELDKLDDYRSAALSRIDAMEKHLREVHAVLETPFDKLDRLIELRKRQLELDAELDMDKGDMAAVDETENTVETAEA